MFKSLLGLFAAGIVSVSAMAAPEAGVNRHPVLPEDAVGQAPATVTASKAMHKRAVDDPTAITDWKSIGTCRYNDGFITQPMGSSAPGQIKYTQHPVIEESASHPGLYRVINPYKGHGYLFDEEYDDSKTYYMIVDATDPDKVVIPSFDTGVICEDLHVWGDGDNGKLKDGVITFEEWALAYKLGEDGTRAVCNWQKTFRLCLPGTIDYDFSISVDGCVHVGEQAGVSLAAGADITTIKYAVSAFPATEAEVYTAAETSNLRFTPGGDNSISVSNPGIYRIAAVAYNSANKDVASYSGVFTVASANDSEWEEIGTTVIKEGIVATFFGGQYGPNTETKIIQEHKTQKGRYRIVNPMSHMFGGYYCHTNKHDDYLVINATDPERIYIETSYLGIDMGYGNFGVTSDAARAIEAGRDLSTVDASTFGSVVDGALVIPVAGQKVFMVDYLNAATVDGGSELTLVIPGEHTVSVVSSPSEKYGKAVIVNGDEEVSKITTDAPSLTLKATPADNLVFAGWTDEKGNDFGLATECVYRGSASKTFTAHFAAVLTLGETPNATIKAMVDGEEVESGIKLVPGTEVTVEVTPAQNYEVKGIKLNDRVLDGVYTFTIEESVTVTALVAGVEYPLTVETVGKGEVQIWSGVSTDDDSPLAPSFASGSKIGYGAYLAIYYIPGEKESLKSTSIVVDGVETPLTIGDEVWETSWQADRHVMVADVFIEGVTVVKAEFTGETSIESIGSDSDLPAEYFTLQGVKVSGKLLPGLYIKRQGNKTVKVVVE